MVIIIKMLRRLSALILLSARLLIILFEFAVNNEIIMKPSLDHDFAVFNADDAVCKKSDVIIVSDHYYGLVKFFTAEF